MIVDTNLWSLYLRRVAPRDVDRRYIHAVRQLIALSQLILTGPIRQEVLSGMRDRTQFLNSREQMRLVADADLVTFDFERAAEFSNACRTAGLAGSPVDVLICAVSERLKAPIFTLDRDFERYRDILGIELYEPA